MEVSNLKIKKKIIVILLHFLVIILLGVGIYLYSIYIQGKLIAEMMVASSVLGRIDEKFLIIDVFQDPDATRLFLNDPLLTNTNFFIWKRTFSTSFSYKPIFSNLEIDAQRFLKESINEIIKTFKCKSLKNITEIKILKKGISFSEGGLPLPWVKASYKNEGNRSIIFATNFTYIDEEGLFSEIILIAISEESKYNQEEIQKLVYGILRENPRLTKETEAIKDLQNEENDLATRKEAISVLIKMGSERAIDALLTALKDKNREIRKETAFALRRLMASKKVVEALCSALNDDDKEVRRSAASSLMEINSIYAIDPLINVLEDDKDTNVRLTAILALTKLKDKRAVGPFITLLLRDENEVIRSTVAMSLGEISDRRAIKPLISALEDESDLVRRWAAISLGKIGDKSAVSILSKALQDPDKDVQKAAKEAIEMISRSQKLQK